MTMQKRLKSLERFQIHFIGVGGIGMCGLAEILLIQGARVSGSDLKASPITRRLEDLGLQFFEGHASGQIGNADVLVISSAIREDNPELMEAAQRKIPIISRAEALAEISRMKRSVAVAGSHGKTTTTSFLATAMVSLDFHPTVVVGGRLLDVGSTVHMGTGPWILAEADESDGSFQKLSPEIAVITNIDNDHLDYYQSMENLVRAFAAFADRIPFYGLLVSCADDPFVQKLLGQFRKPSLTYGFGPQNDFQIVSCSGRQARVRVQGRGRKVVSVDEFSLESPLPGRHNLLNSLATVLVMNHLGASASNVIQALKGFKGVDRRFHFQGEIGKAKIYDDYGHHPTEVRATLQAFREFFPNKKIMVVFQPHRYSRTQVCWDEFCKCFDLADQVFITDIYAAGERPLPGIDALSLAKSVQHPNVQYLAKSEISGLSKSFHEDVVLVLLGAGDINRALASQLPSSG